jgi:hypothetical protein
VIGYIQWLSKKGWYTSYDSAEFIAVLGSEFDCEGEKEQMGNWQRFDLILCPSRGYATFTVTLKSLRSKWQVNI